VVLHDNCEFIFPLGKIFPLDSGWKSLGYGFFQPFVVLFGGDKKPLFSVWTRGVLGREKKRGKTSGRGGGGNPSHNICHTPFFFLTPPSGGQIFDCLGGVFGSPHQKKFLCERQKNFFCLWDNQHNCGALNKHIAGGGVFFLTQKRVWGCAHKTEGFRRQQKKRGWLTNGVKW